MQNFFLGLIIATFMSLPSWALNYQDLWWNPAESGWGVNVVQQGDVLFATWFIYDANSQPTWFSSDLRRPNSNVNVYTGSLFATTGSGFALPTFNPATVVRTPVGTATFTFADAKSGTLVYVANGQTVTKAISRITFSGLPIAGTYFGGVQRNTSGCINAASNGSILTQAIYQITVDPATASISLTEIGPATCRYSGNYQQYGSTFEASGALTCTDGTSATWTAREGVVTDNTLSAKLNIVIPGETCLVTGILGGLKTQ